MIDSASKSSVSDEELDLVLCTMDDVIIEQLYEESISLANEVNTGMQGKRPVKRVRFVDEVKMAKKKRFMGDNSKSIMNIDGQSFNPLLQGLG